MRKRPTCGKRRILVRAALVVLSGLAFLRGYGVPPWLDGPVESVRAFLSGSPKRGWQPGTPKFYPSSAPSLRRRQPGLEHFTALDYDNGLSTNAAWELGLGWWQYQQVDALLRADWQEQSVAFIRRAVWNPGASDEAAGVLVYWIPALPDRGLAHWQELEAKLVPVIGERKANLLVNSLGNSFATYGKDDVHLRCSPLGTGAQYEFEVSDSITGSSKTRDRMDIGAHRYGGTRWYLFGGSFCFSSD